MIHGVVLAIGLVALAVTAKARPTHPESNEPTAIATSTPVATSA